MAIEIKAYLCEHCKKKVLRSKSGIKYHEDRCYWNPETKSCMTCENYLQGGHYHNRCYYQHMNNISNEDADSQYDVHIERHQHHCDLYKYDGLTLEERNKNTAIGDANAQSDWDEYYSNM